MAIIKNGLPDHQIEEIQDRWNGFYSRRDWPYRPKDWRMRFLQRCIIDVAGLDPNTDSVFELACGSGFIADCWRTLGFSIEALDASQVAIERARDAFPDITFRCDVCEHLGYYVKPESLDCIYTRGNMWYHFELEGINKQGVDVVDATKKAFSYLKPGGVFAMEIWTDWHGGYGGTPTGEIRSGTVEEYRNLFAKFGEVLTIRDWEGADLTKPGTAPTAKGVLIVTRKD